jgi:hypothetical protein
MKFTVRKIYKYTVDVEVEADSADEAKELALLEDGERNEDDWLYDWKVVRKQKD